MHVIADDCVYEDVVFQDPFVGKQQIRDYFADIVKYLDKEVQFKIDDVSQDSSGKVGLLWHVEVDGIPIPFSRGCSFVRLNSDGNIVFARDVVEPAIKPGHNAMKLMTIVVPVVKRLGKNADPASLKKLPIASALLWGFYAFYVWHLLLSPNSPGMPVWATPPDTIQRIAHEFVNFTYLNVALKAVGWNIVPSIAEHPVDEALFNFVGAWGLMFLPVMLADQLSKKSMKPVTKWSFWIGTWFLTNFFFIPYNALRLAPGMDPDEDQMEEYPSWSSSIAAASGLLGTFSIFWALYGRQEYGGISERFTFLLYQFSHDRVFYAFVLDVVLFSLFQILLLNKRAGLTSVPFFGLIFHLFTVKKSN